MRILIKIWFCIFGVIIGLIFQSCEDINDYPTIIKGKIQDFYTNEPISDFKIILTETKSVLFGTYFNEKDSIKSDSNGEFSYSFTAENKCKYHIMAFDGKYQGFSKQELNYETTNRIELKVKPLKVISLQLKNTTGKYKRISFPNSVYISSFKFVDTTIILDRVVPDANYKLEIGLYDCETCSNYIVRSETIWIKNIDTTYLKREY